MLLMPTYRNYTDAITWPFVRLTNAYQSLRRTNQIFFSPFKISFVTSVHNKVTSISLMVFVARYTRLATGLSKISLNKYIWQHLKPSEYFKTLLTRAAYGSTNRFGCGKFLLHTRDISECSNEQVSDVEIICA